MSTSHRPIEWFDAHRDIAFDLIRIYLGIALFIRGWLFVSDPNALADLLGESADTSFLSAALIHYVALAHLGGGFLLTLGLLTRVAALVQVPVLIGAVFVVHLGEGFLNTGQSLELSTLVLFLLIVIFLHGSGRLSLDYLFFEREQAQVVRAAQLGLFKSARPQSVPEQPTPAMKETAMPAVKPEPVVQAVPAGCTCDLTRDRDHSRVRVERRYGMGALRFLTGTTGTPREVAFRCRDCGQVVETSTSPEDIAYYAYR